MIGAVIHPLTQVLAGLEVRNVLARERDGLTGLGIAALARGPEVQREAAEAANFDALPLGERITHDFQDLLQRQLNVLRRQMLLLRRDDLDEFRFRHGCRHMVSSRAARDESTRPAVTAGLVRMAACEARRKTRP